MAAEDAAFTTIASIALHGLRIAEVGPGAKVVVIGLGLVGQLASRLAVAAGCAVAGIDPAETAREYAGRSGILALDERGAATTDEVLAWSRGRGADAVLVCAASRSSDVIGRVPALCRDRAAVVVVGDVGLELNRTPFYERELSVRFARSYGPGRYDPSYEAWGVDYPAGQVRWTEGRNFEAVLDLLASGRLQVSDLVTHTFELCDAAAAYELIEHRAEPYLAIRLTYPEAPADDAPVVSAARRRRRLKFRARRRLARRRRRSRRERSCPRSGAPASTNFAAISSASGLSARRTAENYRFDKAVSGSLALIDDPGVEVVVVATPHDISRGTRHAGAEVRPARLLRKAAGADHGELQDVELAWRASGRQLTIGFNRRWSPAVLAAAARARRRSARRS